MKKNAWTLAEMSIAIIILMLLSFFVLSAVKGNKTKTNIFAYSALRNFMKGNAYLIDAYEDAKNQDFKTALKDIKNDSETVIQEGYCIRIAEAFGLSAEPECNIAGIVDNDSARAAIVNIRFPNNITLQGLANNWKTPYTGANYHFKNALIDIDGEQGQNRLGIDRFPVRIYDGTKGDYSVKGIVAPINCSKDVVYNGDTEVTLTEDTGKSPYCGTSTVDVASDASVFAYNIYRPQDNSEKAKADLISFGLSSMESDCAAHGGLGFYSAKECSEKAQAAQAGAGNDKVKKNRYRVRPECLLKDMCSKLDEYTLPLDPDTEAPTANCQTMASTTNSEEFICITALRKPSTGTSLILDTAIQGIFMD